MQIYRADRYKKMPWKNGLGTTSEIFIYPVGSTVGDLNFSWRLSSADLPLKSEFSQFPGYKRFLALIRGQSMSLNGEIFDKYMVAQFSGGQTTHCTCDDNSSLDIGLIYDPQKITPTFRIIQTPEFVSEQALVVYLGNRFSNTSIDIGFLDSVKVESGFKVPASSEHPFLIIYGLEMNF